MMFKNVSIVLLLSFVSGSLKATSLHQDAGGPMRAGIATASVKDPIDPNHPAYTADVSMAWDCLNLYFYRKGSGTKFKLIIRTKKVERDDNLKIVKITYTLASGGLWVEDHRDKDGDGESDGDGHFVGILVDGESYTGDFHKTTGW